MADTPAERKRRSRQKAAKLGLVRFEMITTPEWKKRLKSKESEFRKDSKEVEL